MSYDLDQAQQKEAFEFTLGGNKYMFTYPTSEEIEQIDSLRDDKGELINKEVEAKMYAYIQPVDKEAPAIAEAMKKARIPTIRAFNDMVKTEFGLGE